MPCIIVYRVILVTLHRISIHSSVWCAISQADYRIDAQNSSHLSHRCSWRHVSCMSDIIIKSLWARWKVLRMHNVENVWRKRIPSFVYLTWGPTWLSVSPRWVSPLVCFYPPLGNRFICTVNILYRATRLFERVMHVKSSPSSKNTLLLFLLFFPHKLCSLFTSETPHTLFSDWIFLEELS